MDAPLAAGTDTSSQMDAPLAADVTLSDSWYTVSLVSLWFTKYMYEVKTKLNRFIPRNFLKHF